MTSWQSLSTTAEYPGWNRRRRLQHVGQHPQIEGSEIAEVLEGVQKPLLLNGVHHAGAELAEFSDVLRTPERPGASRMSIGNGELVADHLAVVQRDLRARPEGRLRRVIATTPLRVFDGGDLSPELDCVRPM